MRKAARGHARGFVTTRVGQGLALDVRFMFGRSKDKNRAKRLEGLNGGNAYCIIYDFKTEALFGVTMSGKIFPITWLHILITWIAPRDAPGCIVRLDLGGETGKNPIIVALFVKHNYILQRTGARVSSQNGSGERPHSTIGTDVRTMLYSSQFFQHIGNMHFIFTFASMPFSHTEITSPPPPRPSWVTLLTSAAFALLAFGFMLSPLLVAMPSSPPTTSSAADSLVTGVR
jgi:hypothetical protein